MPDSSSLLLPPDPAAQEGASRYTRREFIKRVIATGAVASAAAYVYGGLSGCSRKASLAGGIERLISLNVNGEVRRVDVLPQETLAMTLRYKLGLTGTKLGCDRAECGACTVMIDDVCALLVLDAHAQRSRAQDRDVEGLAGPNGELHPVQQAFVDELGPQCGFCTPGQVMSRGRVAQTEPETNTRGGGMAMSGNLCRCGAYDNYLNAVMRAAGG